MSKFINGCWQISQSHMSMQNSADENVANLMKYVEFGYNTFDCGDIYTGVEEALGKLKNLANANKNEIEVYTKFVPDLNMLPNITKEYVRNIAQRSRDRLRVSKLKLVQFHWWDYNEGDFLRALGFLHECKNDGIIENIGLTNFNSTQLQKIIKEFPDVYSMQMQYSLLDTRPNNGVLELCKKHGIKVFAYGVLGGGFLQKKWLGAKEPNDNEIPNRSLVKYKLIIDDCGGWDFLQSMLQALNVVAQRHNSSIADVAMRYMMNNANVDKIIIGVKNIDSNPYQPVEKINLTDDDMALIAGCISQSTGDVYDAERDKVGRHAKIMKYNLNKADK